jgi:hypothetical protein
MPQGDGADLPPLVTAAAGRSAAGDRWAIKVGGTRADCLTLMEIEFADGHPGVGGGLGGPALTTGRLMNMSWHRSDSGVAFVVGRVHPSIARVHVQLSDAESSAIDLEPAGDPTLFGVRFVGAVLPPAARPFAIWASNGSGESVDREDLGRQDVALGRLADFDSGAGGQAEPTGGGWYPT